jgi:hypothetical protein
MNNLGLAAKNVQPGEVLDVALKVIPKKKVKGNEDSVWGEMNVLRGLDHKNIVRVYITWSMTFHWTDFPNPYRSNSTNGSSLETSTISLLNWQSVENSSNECPSSVNSPRAMLRMSFGVC